jgi:hypothetical protein
MAKPRALTALTIAAAVLGSVSGPSRADDRDLLRTGSSDPFVFILLDTSGSMNWRLPSFDAVNGNDTMPSLRGDAQDSKLYQAKESLYQVVSRINDVNFGFGTFNQDDLRIRAKHWLYTAGASATTPIDVPGFGTFPTPGAEDVFGLTIDCTEGNTNSPQNGNNEDRGCSSTTPARSNVPWEMRRIQMLPKLGDRSGPYSTTTFYFTSISNGCVWRADYSRNPANATNQVGNPTLLVDVRVRRISGGGACVGFDQTRQIPFTLVQEFVGWDFSALASPSEGFFGQGSDGGSDIFIDSSQNSTCKGWDANDDDGSDDTTGGYRHRILDFTPTPATPAFTQAVMQYGDVIPLDWRDGRRNQDVILERLAPNLLDLPAAATPDFRVSPYLEDTPSGNPANIQGKQIVGRPATSAWRYRPIVASGSTPLGNSIKDFRFFHRDWRPLAAVHDPQWSCRNVYLLLLTDGNETCNSDAQGQTTALFNQGVKTFVVGFGVRATPGGDTLDDIADRGGTGTPFRPETPEDLVRVLESIFSRIREEQRAFASAAVPSVQAEVADKIYLTSFTPLRNEPVWVGHADTYLKPLPLTNDGRPDRALVCPGTPDDTACFVWDAAVELLEQSPNNLAQTAIDRQLGIGLQERRVVYPQAAVGNSVPRSMRLFDYPTSLTDKYDLWSAMQIPFTPGDTASEGAAQSQAENVINVTLTERVATVDSVPQPGEILPANCERLDPTDLEIRCTYIMGDVFHADPVVVSSPNNFAYFATNVDSYQFFALQHRFRRKMLISSSNDGQVHAFDAGTFVESNSSPQGNRVFGTFTNGTGQELFSFIPRISLPDVRLLAEKTDHRFVVDGTPVVDDFFIDPEHNGVPDPDDREWRTVLVSGLREGGSERGTLAPTYGYYALDITSPDSLIERKNGDDQIIGFVPQSPDYVPSCITTDCGRPYPFVLWEFTDTADDDVNGRADLGETWSKPNTGRIRVLDEEGNLLTKYVAIFGGGLDPLGLHQSGNHLYIVDVETGRPIYKRELDGAAPSEPAAVDTDQDGLLDTVYIGTTLGFLYKVDLRTPQVLVEDAVLGPRVTSLAWEPFKIFTTGGRPIYFPPAVVFVTRLARYALAFGTGQRSDLWEKTLQTGRFYAFVDDNWTSTTTGLPRTEASYQAVGPEDTVTVERDFLQTAPFGWYLTLRAEERVITPAFSLSGITVFTSYNPVICLDRDADGLCDDDGDPDPPDPDEGEILCAKTGDSRIFVLFTLGADPVITLAGEKTRYWELGGSFVTEPYTEQSATKNPPTGSGVKHADQLTPELEAIRQTLQKLFPPGYRFANFRVDIKTIRSDTGVFFIAPVPVGMLEANWTEN